MYARGGCIWRRMSDDVKTRVIPPEVHVRVETPPTDRRAVPRPGPDRRQAPPTVRPGGSRELTLTLREVADVLKVDVRTIKKLIRSQALVAIRVSPRNTRVTERALAAFLEGRSHPNTL
jgi:excisionase family DNA binding protein